MSTADRLPAFDPLRLLVLLRTIAPTATMLGVVENEYGKEALQIDLDPA